jgi:hypothetical protein
MEPGALNAAESRHTAVVWTDPSRPEPVELLGALTGRGIDAVLVGDRYMATAEVCRVYRARGARAGRGPSGAMLALVIVSPETQGGTCELCEVVARYAGGTRCWMFGPASSPQLRPINDGDLALWSGAPAESPDKAAAKPGEGTTAARSEGGPAMVGGPPKRVRALKGPQLRLAGTEAASEKPEGAAKASERNADLGVEGAAESTGSGRPLLTPEELAMLLGDENPAER